MSQLLTHHKENWSPPPRRYNRHIQSYMNVTMIFGLVMCMFVFQVEKGRCELMTDGEAGEPTIIKRYYITAGTIFA